MEKRSMRLKILYFHNGLCYDEARGEGMMLNNDIIDYYVVKSLWMW